MAEVTNKVNNENEKRYEKNNTVSMDKYWKKRLAKNEKGNVAKTIDNFCIILENLYANKIFLNELSNKVELVNSKGIKKPIETVDYDELQRYIEKEFCIYDVKKLGSAIRTIAKNNKFHPVIEYLNSLTWDGKKRADTAFSYFLGANEEDDEYNAMCLRLFLFGAIERVFNPGAKFQIMLIINGAQGIGKSSFFNTMCGGHREFYEENFNNFDKAFEYTNGKWIVEISELNAFGKADIRFLKGYITQASETHRIPYEPESKQYLRQFVLFGTTNEMNFIPDDESGDRRFVVVEAADDRTKKNIKKKVWEEGADYEIQQILAEVYQEYKDGKKFLEVPEEFKERVFMKNKEHKVDDGLSGMIEGYLDDKQYCCAQEIYKNVIENLKLYKYSKALSSRIIEIVLRIPGWRKYSGSKDHRKHFTEYGKQVAFERYETEEEKEAKAQEELEKKKKQYAMQKEHDNAMMNKILKTENEDYFNKI